MVNSEFLDMVYRKLGLKSPGTDTRNEVLEAMNSVLLVYAGGGFAHYKGWTVQDIPAPATLTLTRSAANLFSYSGTPLGNANVSRIIVGTYSSDVLYVDTSAATITVEKPIPATFAPASGTQYCVGLNLDNCTMPYMINAALGTGSMVPLGCMGLQDSTGEDQLTFEPFDREYDTPGTDLTWRYEHPKVQFKYPQSAATSVRLQVLRMPVIAVIDSYSASQVVDWPSAWEQLLALKTAQACGALAANQALVQLIAPQIAALESAMKQEQLPSQANARAAKDARYSGYARPVRFVQ